MLGQDQPTVTRRQDARKKVKNPDLCLWTSMKMWLRRHDISYESIVVMAKVGVGGEYGCQASIEVIEWNMGNEGRRRTG